MALFENIKNGVEFVSETFAEFAASVAEKNRLRMQLNHIKGLIRNDSATRDQAYIELGRYFYENMRDGATPENEAICAVVDAASERISTASVKYMELLNLQNETKIRSENAEKLKKAVADKASASAKAAKEKSAELGQKAKTAATEAMDKAKNVAADLKDKASDTLESVKDRFNMDRGEVDEIIAAEEQKAQETCAEAAENAAETAEEAAQTVAAAPAAEESPDDFEF